MSDERRLRPRQSAIVESTFPAIVLETDTDGDYSVVLAVLPAYMLDADTLDQSTIEQFRRTAERYVTATEADRQPDGGMKGDKAMFPTSENRVQEIYEGDCASIVLDNVEIGRIYRNEDAEDAWRSEAEAARMWVLAALDRLSLAENRMVG